MGGRGSGMPRSDAFHGAGSIPTKPDDSSDPVWSPAVGALRVWGAAEACRSPQCNSEERTRAGTPPFPPKRTSGVEAPGKHWRRCLHELKGT